MYKDFFGLNRSPFELSPDPSFLCPSAKIKEALASIMYAVANRKGIVVLTGEVGTGKTMIVRSLFEMWKRKQIAFANIVAPKLSVIDFLSYAAIDLGIEIRERSKGYLLRALYIFVIAQFEKGLTTVLVIDEAHQIPTDVLEEIRMLTNVETDQQKLMQVLLIGQPELDTQLDAFELRQLKQRIAIRCQLEPLGERETREYVERRLELAGANAHSKTIFPAETTEAIYGYSRGIPRLINSLCSQALMTAHARQVRVVSVEVIDEVASYLRLQNVAGLRPTSPLPPLSPYGEDSVAEMYSQEANAANDSAIHAVDPETLVTDVDVACETVEEVVPPNKPQTSTESSFSDVGGAVRQKLLATLGAQAEVGNHPTEHDSRKLGRIETVRPNSDWPSGGSALSGAPTAVTALSEPPPASIQPLPPATESIPQQSDQILHDTRPVQTGRWLEPMLRLAAAVVIIVALTTGVIMARRPNGVVTVPHKLSSTRDTLPIGQTVTSLQPAEASTQVSGRSVDHVAPRTDSGISKSARALEHFSPRTNIVISTLSKPLLQSSHLLNPAELPPIVGTQTKDFELGKGLLDSIPGPIAPGANTGGHLQPPKIISSPPPAYPSRAHMAKVQGVVVINALVDETGKVADMKVISGSALLTESAMSALSVWKYEPARLDGQPVATHIQVSINFNLH